MTTASAGATGWGSSAVLTILAASLVSAVAGSGGLAADVSSLTSVADWQCFQARAGITTAIVRAWHSYGAPDQHAPASLRNARAAGISDTMAYLFPCFSKQPAAQLNQTLAGLGSARGLVRRLWLDIEYNPSAGCGWSTDLAANCAFIKDLVASAGVAGMPVGVYASHREWEAVAGGSSCDLSEDGLPPLWYAHYDHNSSSACADFEQFGGWTAPTLKQYDNKVSGDCAAGVQADISCRCL